MSRRRKLRVYVYNATVSGCSDGGYICIHDVKLSRHVGERVKVVVIPEVDPAVTELVAEIVRLAVSVGSRLVWIVRRVFSQVCMNSQKPP